MQIKYLLTGNEAGCLYAPAGTVVDVLYEEGDYAMCQANNNEVELPYTGTEQRGLVPLCLLSRIYDDESGVICIVLLVEESHDATEMAGINLNYVAG